MSIPTSEHNMRWEQDADGDWWLFDANNLYVGIVGQNSEKTQYGIFYGVTFEPIETGTAEYCKKRLVEIVSGPKS